MRDPKRIPGILHDVQRVWEAFPDMRLGQLLLNVAADPALYYLEDDELVHRLLEFGYRFAKDSLNGKES